MFILAVTPAERPEGERFAQHDGDRVGCHPCPLRRADPFGKTAGGEPARQLPRLRPWQHYHHRGKCRRLDADSGAHGAEARLQGLPEFQAHLHQELEATISGPIAKHDRWATNAPGLHILNRFADAITGNLRDTLGDLDTAVFDNAAALLSDRKRSIYFVGGRITGALAEYFFTHMQVIRPKTTLMSSNSSAWPQYMLNMSAGDVLVIFDIRRYEHDMTTLAEVAKANGVQIILFTDQWTSPVARHALHTFRVKIEAPSAWDSSVVTLFVVEALIEAVQSGTWDETKERMNALEGLFEQTRLFRRPDRT